MDFELPEDIVQVRDSVRRFVRDELLPQERTVIRREAERGLADTPIVPPDVAATLDAKAKALGLWGIDVPAQFGGQELGALVKCVVPRTQILDRPFVLRPDSPSLHFLNSAPGPRSAPASVRVGEKKSCLALTEAGGGRMPALSDARGADPRRWRGGSKTSFPTRAPDFIVHGRGRRDGRTPQHPHSGRPDTRGLTSRLRIRWSGIPSIRNSLQ
jgi:alkylation response protein AidB-like acyl-CoA dehydrogenase